MVVTSMRIDSTARLVFQRHLHLMSVPHGDYVSWKQLTIVRNDHRKLITIFHVNGQPIKMISVLLKHKVFCALASNGFDGKYNLLVPDFHGHTKLQALTGTVTPVHKANSVGLLVLTRNFIR